MIILIVGGKGTIGRKVHTYLSLNHEIITAGRSSGDVRVDITDHSSIQTMYNTVPALDAVVVIAGEARWAPFDSLSEDDFYTGIRSKLMGQVNIVRIGQQYLNENGSFTLTTGILADDPVVQTTSAAMVNGALHSFVKAAALEMTGGRRINAVCPGLVEDSAEKYADYFPGHNPVPMKKVVKAFQKSVEGKINGQIIRIYD